MESINLYPVKDLPLVKTGDNLSEFIVDSLNKTIGVEDNDIIVIAQKVVSKAEGAIVSLSEVEPSIEAKEIASQTGRDPRLCQIYLDEASEVIAIKGRMVITRHKLGFVGSSSGVDRSNIAPYEDEKIVLLPKNPDLSAENICKYVHEKVGKKIAVIINDSCGRDYRGGSVGMAIGISGIGAIETRVKKDLFGNESKNQIALVDELAAAASILMGQADEGIPVVLIRGVYFTNVENANIKDFLH
jgi:coenzyme F420-0:L-glutamate ligase/coenzyme F420-1:gamma-L-glutamate ligase